MKNPPLSLNMRRKTRPPANKILIDSAMEKKLFSLSLFPSADLSAVVYSGHKKYFREMALLSLQNPPFLPSL